MTKQCPSCGGDCGYTKAKGCQYDSGPNLTMTEMQFGIAMQLKKIESLLKANMLLVAALDRINDVLRGIYVDDVAGIVNRALDANMEALK